MNIVIRPISNADCEAVQKIANNVLASDFADYSDSIKSKILKEDLNIQDRMNVPVITTFVAFENNSPVGFISGIGPVGGILEIHWLMVLKEFQGKGIGRMLIEEYMKAAKEKGTHAAHVFSAEFNVAFYEKVGFETVGLVKNNYWGADDYFMNKVF